MNTAEAPVSTSVRDQAIAWFTLEQSGCMREDEQRQLQSWRQANSEHERAWQRMVGIPRELQQRTALLSDPAARAALENNRPLNDERRRALKALVGLSLLGGMAWRGSDSQWVRGRFADYHTVTGERREQRLDDGTRIWLNTCTAVDVRFDAHSRLLLLRHGEVNILTAADPTGRPFMVLTDQVRLRPIGTRFNVRQLEGETLLSVSNGSVAATARSGAGERIIEQGWSARIDAYGISEPSHAKTTENAWTDGFIVADRMRLDDFVEELARYRPGVLRCDPAVAELRLTGSFPLDNGERILAMLENSLPVRVRRLTPYWLTVTAS